VTVTLYSDSNTLRCSVFPWHVTCFIPFSYLKKNRAENSHKNLSSNCESCKNRCSESHTALRDVHGTLSVLLTHVRCGWKTPKMPAHKDAHCCTTTGVWKTVPLLGAQMKLNLRMCLENITPFLKYRPPCTTPCSTSRDTPVTAQLCNGTTDRPAAIRWVSAILMPLLHTTVSDNSTILQS